MTILIATDLFTRSLDAGIVMRCFEKYFTIWLGTSLSTHLCKPLDCI